MHISLDSRSYSLSQSVGAAVSMDVLMFQGLGMYGSEVAANSQIHVNSRIGEAWLKPRNRNWSVIERGVSAVAPTFPINV